MSRKSDWNLSKGSKVLSSFCIASGVAFLVPSHFSPQSETLVQVGELPLILYSIGFGLAFLVFGEMLGLSEAPYYPLFRSPIDSVLSCRLFGELGPLARGMDHRVQFRRPFCHPQDRLEYRSCQLLFVLVVQFSGQAEPDSYFSLASAESSKSLRSSISEQAGIFEWVDSEGAGTGSELVEFCKDEKVDLIVMDKSPEAGKVEIIPLLEAGTRVMGVVEFWEQYLEKIPPRQVDQSWLAKLDLRLRDPFSHKLKRLADLVLAVFGLLLSLPLVLPVLVVIAIDSGFLSLFQTDADRFHGTPLTPFTNSGQ